MSTQDTRPRRRRTKRARRTRRRTETHKKKFENEEELEEEIEADQLEVPEEEGEEAVEDLRSSRRRSTDTVKKSLRKAPTRPPPPPEPERDVRAIPEPIAPSLSNRLGTFFTNLGCPKFEFPNIRNIGDILPVLINSIARLFFQFNFLKFFQKFWDILQKLTLLDNMIYHLQSLGFFKSYYQRDVETKIVDHSTIQYFSQDSVDFFKIKVTMQKINTFTGKVEEDEDEQEEEGADEKKKGKKGKGLDLLLQGLRKKKLKSTIGNLKYSCVVGWQQKVFSPREMIMYEDEGTRALLEETQLDELYRNDVKRVYAAATHRDEGTDTVLKVYDQELKKPGGVVEGENEGEGEEEEEEEGEGKKKKRVPEEVVELEEEGGEDEDDEEGGVKRKKKKKKKKKETKRMKVQFEDDSVSPTFGARGFKDLLHHPIFTYTEQDDFNCDEILEPIKCNSQQKYSEQYKKAVGDHNVGLKGETIQTMFLMANFGALKEKNGRFYWEGDEYVLCKIKVYPDGSFDMKPGFSVLPIDDIVDDNIYRQKRKTKKKKKKKFYLTTRNHETYQFSVNLYNERKKDPAIDELRKEILKKMFDRSIGMRKNLVGLFFEDPPDEDEQKVHITGSIVSGRNFSRSGVFIRFLFDHGDSKIHELENTLNEVESGTQISHPCFKNGQYESFFGFPFEYHYVRKKTTVTSRNIGCSPKIYFEVTEVDWFNRHRVVGYGYVDIPLVPGVFEKTVKTWRPISSIRQNLRGYFLGASPALDDIRFVRVPAHFRERFLNKYGLECVPSGTIKVRVQMVLHERKRLVRSRLRKTNKEGGGPGGMSRKSTVRGSIQSLMSSTKSSKMKSLLSSAKSMKIM